MRERAKVVRVLRTAGITGLLLALLLPVAACSRGSRTKTVVETVTETVIETVTETVIVEKEGPYEDLWAESGHADATAEAFRHWDADGEVPTSCAKCHAGGGFQDFLGADGTAFGIVDAAHEPEVINCEACHNTVAAELSSVTFPSGVVVEGLGPEARCMQCHQGRSSGPTVDAAIAKVAPVSDDTVYSSLSFSNVHYLEAAATLYGGIANGGYQYAGKFYDGRFVHVSSLDSCVDCHNPHSLEVRVDKCGRCHEGVADEGDLHAIRMTGTIPDYDGDGNVAEGVAGELETLAEILYAAIRQYGANVAGKAIVYESHTHPYFFIDTNGNGLADPAEATSANRYNAFTARLMRATYNYQYYQKDPGAFAHNAKYVIELLYDSIADLDSVDGVDVPNFANLVRVDSGHFDPTSEAFRHWDGDGEVSSSCARCHSVEGFEFRAEWGVDMTKGAHAADGFTCEMCHEVDASFAVDPALKYVADVTFPSGTKITNNAADPDPSFLCMTCHQGRESKTSVDAAIAAGTFSFKNIHYLSAGPTLYGKDAGVGYEYMGKTYAGKWGHFNPAAPKASQCVYCHLEDHSFQPQLNDSCKACHVEAVGDDVETIRMGRNVDYDGDGNATEHLSSEVATFGERLLAAIMDYAKNTVGQPVAYGEAYPYWVKDLNANGIADPDEQKSSNSYKGWDAKLMKAAFNYQLWHKEPGAWAHNTHYVLQLLFDSIGDLGGSTAGLTRP